MYYRWFPWRWIVKKVARRHGFLDPISLLSQMQRFAKPSEVGEPVELLRAGAVFHARGLMNTRAIQHNLDWVWPYWVQRQFDPGDESFIPRSFSFSHINLTHRNWTAAGLPDCPALPIVDPRGLVTPWYDGWSCDAWVIGEDGEALLPSRLVRAEQELDLSSGLRIVSRFERGSLKLEAATEVVEKDGEPFCRTRYEARSENGANLVLAFRPYNPEGVNFIYTLALHSDRLGGTVNGKEAFAFDQPAEAFRLSQYHRGDVFQRLSEKDEGRREISCEVGMATAAASFGIPSGGSRRVVLETPLSGDIERKEGIRRAFPGWDAELAGASELDVPDERIQFLYDAAVRTLVLHSPKDVFPGPYTYKRFWFRDAAFMVNGLLAAGLTRRAERAVEQFAARQSPTGYFLSQEGEWDSNGEALWTYRQFCRLTGTPPREDWIKAVVSGAKWLQRKRAKTIGDVAHAGLLPAGFSAEHLGPNDFYYWDDFWGVAGLRAAADLLQGTAHDARAGEFREEADRFLRAIEDSLAGSETHARTGALPAAATRRMDSGAVGSLAVDYPLRLWEPGDSRVLKTAEYLFENCFRGGGFFQDMIHSGINAYLTLHIAQVFLRAGDPRAFDLVSAVAGLASPTGQWPEAIHPRTGGGCMGDGQHAWAAADWVVAVRNLFVREEGDGLVLCSGIPRSWLSGDRPVRFGPTPTPFGPVTVEAGTKAGQTEVEWKGEWRDKAPPVEVRLPDTAPQRVSGEEGRVVGEALRQ